MKIADAVLTSKQRWTIVALLSASITINLLDRQTLSVLAPLLREQWKWTNAQYGYIAVAFNLGMMLGQIPAGRASCGGGPRRLHRAAVLYGVQRMRQRHRRHQGARRTLSARHAFARGRSVQCGSEPGAHD
jgi:hypothetical protein